MFGLQRKTNLCDKNICDARRKNRKNMNSRAVKTKKITDVKLITGIMTFIFYI